MVNLERLDEQVLDMMISCSEGRVRPEDLRTVGRRLATLGKLLLDRSIAITKPSERPTGPVEASTPDGPTAPVGVTKPNVSEGPEYRPTPKVEEAPIAPPCGAPTPDNSAGVSTPDPMPVVPPNEVGGPWGEGARTPATPEHGSPPSSRKRVCGVRKSGPQRINPKTREVLLALSREPMTAKEIGVRFRMTPSQVYSLSWIEKVPGKQPCLYRPTSDGLERLRAENVSGTEEVRPAPQPSL